MDAETFFPYPKKIDEKLWDIYMKKITQYYVAPMHYKVQKNDEQFRQENLSIDMNIQKMCISCLKSETHDLKNHPIMKAKLCSACYVSSNFKCQLLELQLFS